MEITGLDLTAFSTKPLVTHHEQASFDALPKQEATHVWLPCLENYLYTEKDEPKINATDMNSMKIVFKDKNIFFNSQHSASKGKTENCFDTISTNYVDVRHSITDEDKFYGRIIQMERLDRKTMHECSILPEKSDPVYDEITMKVVDSGKQSPAEKTGRNSKIHSPMGSTSTSHETAITKFPKTPRKTGDNRRRRDKANEREKQRIVVLKNAMNVLKNAIPAAREKTKITKLEVLKLARDYIHSLREQLMGEEQDGGAIPAGLELNRLHKTSFSTD